MKKIVIFSFLLIGSILFATENNGFIEIISEPNIEVYLDGKFKGVTTKEDGGLFIQDVSAGMHALKFTKDAFLPQRDVIRVGSEQVEAYHVKPFKTGDTGNNKQTKREEEQKISSNKGDFVNSIGIEFVLIPSGGIAETRTGEDGKKKTINNIKISQDFYIGKYEVTQKQWKQIMDENPSNFKGDNLPVENVSWNEVQEFIKRLNKKENTHKYRLPSGPEWKYTELKGRPNEGWTEENSNGKTHKVGSKKSNELGIYDMNGNVWEMRSDWYYDTKGYHFFYYGSSWDSSKKSDSQEYSGFHVSDVGEKNRGFRLMCEIE